MADQVQQAMESSYEQALSVLSTYQDVIIGICIPVALIGTFLGYKLLRAFLFVAGFAFGGFISYSAAFSITNGTSSVVWVSITAMLLGGLLLGLLAMWLVKAGVFLIGAMLGVCISYAFRSLIVTVFPTQPEWVFYVVCGVLAAIFGILAIFLEKPIIIVATSFGGSFGFVYSIGYFVGHFPDFNAMDPQAVIKDKAVWGYFAGFVVLGGLGCWFQFYLASEKWKARSGRGRGSFHADYTAETPRHLLPVHDESGKPGTGQTGQPIIVPFVMSSGQPTSMPPSRSAPLQNAPRNTTSTAGMTPIHVVAMPYPAPTSAAPPMYQAYPPTSASPVYHQAPPIATYQVPASVPMYQQPAAMPVYQQPAPGMHPMQQVQPVDPFYPANGAGSPYNPASAAAASAPSDPNREDKKKSWKRPFGKKKPEDGQAEQDAFANNEDEEDLFRAENFDGKWQ